MFEGIEVLKHSSIRIRGSKTLYFDPFKIDSADHDADCIFITHDHYDHFSPRDIKKAANDYTFIIMPYRMKGCEKSLWDADCVFIREGSIENIDGIMVKPVPAYNRLKPFHKKGMRYTGYLVMMDGIRYYVAGDTDMVPETGGLKCDVAFVPVGGGATMDYKRAAKFVNGISPKLAVPVHYGMTEETASDAGRRFAECVNKNIEVWVML